MNRDLTPIDQMDQDEVEVFEEFAETSISSAFATNGKPITLIAEGLCKYFAHKGGEVKAVDGVSFTFTEQQFITVMGPSGSGKSTLLYVLGGMDQATAGSLHID